MQRYGYQLSWFGQLDDKKVVTDPGGYVAPPLDGIWASAPYLHNGSVPTFGTCSTADARPVVWQRSEDGYDQEKVGLEVTTMSELPATAKTGRRASAATSTHACSAKVPTGTPSPKRSTSRKSRP